MSNLSAETRGKPWNPLYVDIALLRLTGASYDAIGLLYDISRWTALNAVNQAVRRGYVERDRVRRFPDKPCRTALSDDEYHAKLRERLPLRCTIDERGCWHFRGTSTRTGYRMTNYRYKSMHAHRASFIAFNGFRPPTEQYVLHRCDVRDCINPEHLFLGTAKDNNQDCAAKGRHYEGKKTHCQRGHEFSPENTTYKPSRSGGVSRGCKTCIRERHRTKREAA